LLELIGLRLDVRGIAARERLREPPGLHAHAARFVDGGRAAFELPASPWRVANRNGCRKQQQTADDA
jgi:hypothetical protein